MYEFEAFKVTADGRRRDRHWSVFPDCVNGTKFRLVYSSIHV